MDGDHMRTIRIYNKIEMHSQNLDARVMLGRRVGARPALAASASGLLLIIVLANVR